MDQPGEELPKADGPLLIVALPDGQRLYAVVLLRRQEGDGSWWYRVRTHVWSVRDVRGRRVGEPEPVEFDAPADACTPLEGQPYDTVPTEYAAGPRAPWRIEQRRMPPGEQGLAVLVHRGDCASIRDASHAATTEQAREMLARPDGGACPVCRPDRPLRAR